MYPKLLITIPVPITVETAEPVKQPALNKVYGVDVPGAQAVGNE